MTNQLGKNGELFPTNWVVENILRSLTYDFENIVFTMRESKDMQMFSIEKLIAGSLEANKQHKRETRNT